MTNRLCSHPSFQKSPPKEFEISCYNANKEVENAKPKALAFLEKETSSQFLQEFNLFKSASKAPSKKNIFAQLFRIDSTQGDAESGFEQLNAIIEAIKSSTNVGSKKQKTSHSGQKDEQKSTDMASLIESFWSGKICLHGGVGWWQYELCYGRMVTQYHIDGGERQTSIVLGVFHDDDNREWFIKHPEKYIDKGEDGKIIQVSNIYTRGDICEETQAHRKCEVRIICREDLTVENISLEISEPSTCSYVLTVESPLFCAGLQKIDSSTGILDGMPPLQEYEKTHRPQIFSSVPERKTEATLEMPNEANDDSEPQSGKAAIENKPVGSPFQIDVLQQDQLLELVNMFQNEDIVFRKIVIEKTDNKAKRQETEAKLSEQQREEDPSEEQNDKKSKIPRL